MSPAPRRILLCVTGLSPQIITETLYALAVQRSPAWVPDAIHLVTTTEGAERARLELLDPAQGHFHRLCADYGLDAARIRFGADTIHTIAGGEGAALDDIRTEADNAAAADAITAVVRRLTAAPDAEVHASIAGGRKTMGFYLGYAMGLFARPHDRLSHVLVSAPFESHREFFYPPATPRVLHVKERNGERPVHTADAVVTLADIPFVRLRDHLDPALLKDGASYGDTVRRAQRSLGPVELTLDHDTRRARCGAQTFQLTPTSFAWLALFARRAQAGQPAVGWRNVEGADDPFFAEYLAEYEEIGFGTAGDHDRVRDALRRTGIDKNYFEQRGSRLKKELERELGRAPAAPYQLQKFGTRPSTRYGLALRPEQIRFERIVDL